MRPMSANDNNPKIVDLNQRSAAATLGDKPAEALSQMRAHALKRLTALATTLFENADDALFDLASKADNNAVQAQYFDGMREVRKKRQQIEARFQEQLARQFVDFLAGRGIAAKPENSNGEMSLSLVENTELEESLAVASMVAKTENRLQRVLFAINQRVSHISNQRVEDTNSPVGPAAVGQAFRLASSELEVELPVRLIVYKLFDRYVMGGLDQFYDELNSLLVHAGVLPQMRATVARRPGSPMLVCATASGRSDNRKHPRTGADRDRCRLPARGCGSGRASGEPVQLAARTAVDATRRWQRRRWGRRLRTSHLQPECGAAQRR